MAYGTIKVDNITFDNGGTDKVLTVSGLFFSTSGALTVTGTISGGNVTAPTATFTTLTGTTTAGTTAAFASGSFTSLTGVTTTGTTATFTSGSFTSLTGVTTTVTSGVFGLGSAASPSIAFSGDTNNGIYSPGADQVAISTNGTSRIVVDASGNVNIDSNTFYVDAANNRVGIGTAPSYLLHVSKNANNSQPTVLINNTNAGGSAATYFSLGSDSTQNAGITLTSTAWGNYGLFKTQSAVLDAGGTASTFLGLAGQAGILFGVGSNPYSEVMRIDSSGRVGIGTTSPGQLLEVAGNGVFTGGVSGQGAYISRDGATGGAYYGSQTASVSIVAAGANYIDFQTNGSPRARIDSSGKLLVGTSTPRSNIYNSSYSPFVQMETSGALTERTLNLAYNNGGSTPGGAILNFTTSRGSTAGSNTIVANNDELGGINFCGADGTRPIAGAAIGAYVDGTPGNLDMPGRLVFSTTPSGSASPTERMRIKENGYVLINTTTALGNGSLQVRGQGTTQITLQDSTTTAFYHYLGSWNTGTGNFVIAHSTSGVGVQLIGSSATSWSSFSDVRLKNITGSIPDALNKVDKLEPIYFSWKSDSNSTPCVGLSGQSVREVLPEATDLSKQFNKDEDDQEYVSVRYTDVIPLLVAALQESKKRIEALETRLSALEAA